jgi:hypothetical protein
MAMLENAFIGRKTQPTDADLAKALGRTKLVWDELIAELTSVHDVGVHEWRSYSPKAGWSLRLQRRSRTILWLAPAAGCFQAMVILGDRAVADARQAGLSAKLRRLLDEAPRYPEGTGLRLPEGTGLRLPIKTVRDLPAVRALVAVKLRN